MLPFDIIDHILSFLQWDRAALTSCSEADPLLSRIAERHFYARITVEEQIAPSSDPYTFDQYQLYKRLHDNPRIAKYVRDLHLPVSPVSHMLCIPDMSTKQEPTIHLILPMLPLLERIALACPSKYVSWNHLPEKFQQAFMDCLRLPTIKELSLSDITDFPLSSFNRSQTLKKLELRGVMTFENPHPSSRLRPSFDSLSLYRCPPIAKILPWAKTQTLRSLEIGPETDLIELPLLLQVWGPSLTSLNLNMGYGFYKARSHIDIGGDTPVSPEVQLSLPKIPFLERITVRSIVSLHHQLWARNHTLEALQFCKSALPTIIALVFCLTSPSLKHITLSLHLSINGPLSFSDVDWSPLDTLSQLGVPLELRISANKASSHIPPLDVLRSLQKIDSLSKLVERRALVLKGEGKHPFV